MTAINPAQYEESLRQLDTVTTDRRERLLTSREGLPGIIWVALVGGSILTVGFSLLFGVERAHFQAAIVGALAIEVSLLLFVVFMLDHPFQGDIHLRPDGLELFLQQFGGTAASSP